MNTWRQKEEREGQEGGVVCMRLVSYHRRGAEARMWTGLELSLDQGSVQASELLEGVSGGFGTLF